MLVWVQCSILVIWLLEHLYRHTEQVLYRLSFNYSLSQKFWETVTWLEEEETHPLCLGSI